MGMEDQYTELMDSVRLGLHLELGQDIVQLSKGCVSFFRGLWGYPVL
jgi:hypothetical protein